MHDTGTHSHAGARELEERKQEGKTARDSECPQPGTERTDPSEINAQDTHYKKFKAKTEMGTMNAQTSTEHKDGLHRNSIDAFFAGTVILLTGATGFLGKVLLEKLLRSCSQISTVYVLIRPKKNQSVEQRYKDLINNPVFDRIRSEFPGTLNKIFPVEGDVGLPELGLRPKDRDILIRRVNIVFHSAATVRFNEPLKIAVRLNVMGTDRILDLCRRMTNLISLVHVSTAYSNADRREIDEIIYMTDMKPYTLINICESLDDEMLEMIEKKLVGKHPNTYTLTKSLAEQLIKSKGDGLPIAIVRPSIICAALQEPFPGWVDNTSGITGIILEIGRGTCRSILCNKKLVVDIVPVDFVVHTLICAAWYNTVHYSGTINVYNCTSSSVRPIIWDELKFLLWKSSIEYPSKYVMWYPGTAFTMNKSVHAIMVFMLHYLPAFIADLILRIQGRKPIMLKITKRFERAAKNGKFFAINEWTFHTKNMMKLVQFVKASNECNKFNVDITTLDWNVYLQHYVLGIRKYILKDNLDTLNNSRSQLSRLYWIHNFFKIISMFALLGLIKYIIW